MPESLARGFRRVHTGTQYLDWTGRGRADARRRSEDRGKRIQKLNHARRDTGADVEDPRVGPGEGPENGLHHVRDVHVVALIAAVPEDRDWLAPFPAADEDRDHTALEVLSLARPVDVRKTERHGPQVRRLDQLFGLRLESAVVRRRIHRYVLFGAARRFPVDRSSGRDIHDDRGTEAPRGLEHVAGPADDDALVELFLGHRLDDLRLRRAVHDGVDPPAAELALQRRQIRDVRDAQVPFDDGAEQQVLGSLLIDRDAIFKVADLLRVDDFYVPRHQRIYDAAQALLERRERIDPLTIQMELARREELDRAGGQAYLRALAEGVPTAAEIDRYGRIVRDRAILPRLPRAATSIAGDAYDEPTDIALALDRAEQRLFALRDESSNAQLRHITASLQSNYEHLTDRMERPFEVSGIPSGFREVDYYTEGFTVGDLIVLAARPSVGKTSLALGMSFNVARRGHPVLLFSLEMDAKQIVSRYLALNSRMDLLALRTGNIIDTDAAAALHGLPVFIDDTPGISIMELRTKARRASTHEKIEVIIVDYLQLVRGGGDEENRVQEIATITRNLKSLARELGVVIIGLSQLSRAAGDSGGEPKLSTLRECVTGDTIVCLADGRRVPISELVGTCPEVLSVENDRIATARTEKLWAVGRRPVFRVRLTS